MNEAYIELRNKIRERRKNEELTKKNRITLEQAIQISLPQHCTKCSSIDNLTLDHIIPRDLLLQFGVDVDHEIVEENYQILCRRCNIFKANRLDFSNPKTKELLIKLLGKI
jgi:5-methylcytosine-specific restriction endonuclease McrA